ncbi:coilin [Nothoprocta perdicaria]|uniref:coilin n=1 Tax=Nothoprocta perdicaria TaxID=30464 RepID=UPI000E1C3DF8|nr:coilin [Nothoprocta perdicaria]
MAAGSGGALRLRLLFDYPPPGSPGCALCWLLLEPAQVRLVTDLLSLIRQRFGFSRRARLSLFLEGALLPPAESARLVRDNDSLRVKLDDVESDEERGRRRRKRSEEREAAASDGETPRKRKRRKRKEESGAQEGPAAGEEGSGAGRIRRAKRAASKRTEGTRAPAKAASAREQDGKSGAKGSARSGAPGAAPSEPSSTSSSSDSSEGNARQNKSSHKPAAATTLPKNASPAAANSSVKTGVSSKVTVKSKAAQSKTAVSKKTNQAQSSSSDSDSSAEEGKAATAQNSATQKKLLPNNTAPVKTSTPKAPNTKTSSSESDSSDSETLVTKKPKANAGLSNSLVRNGDKQSPAGVPGALPSPVLGRGRGTGDGNFWKGSRGRGFQGAARGRGRGENQGFFYNYDSEGQKQRQINEPVTNTSIVVQNPVEVPKRNYSVLPLLAAPPQVGERIAFKRLELNDNYSPEVSDYKEGKIISWNADKKQIELEILSSPAVAKEPGKFDLVYQSADGAELIEYAVPQDTKITENWDALIEPRLIVEPSVNGSNLENGRI